MSDGRPTNDQIMYHWYNKYNGESERKIARRFNTTRSRVRTAIKAVNRLPFDPIADFLKRNCSIHDLLSYWGFDIVDNIEGDINKALDSTGVTVDLEDTIDEVENNNDFGLDLEYDNVLELITEEPIVRDCIKDALKKVSKTDSEAWVNEVGKHISEELTESMINYLTKLEPEYDYNIVATNKSISVTRVDKNTNEAEQISIDSSFGQFSHCWNMLLQNGIDDKATLEEIYNLGSIKNTIEAFSMGNVTVDVESDSVSYKGYKIDSSMSDRIIRTVSEEGKEGAERLIRFFEKLMENPSKDSIEQLYDFLQHNDIEIDSEGYIIAWKYVDNNFKDCHTGTMDNSPGSTVWMPRHEVDDNPNETCSRGLHVCARSYLGSKGSRIVKVRLHPKDVVSVPTDYDGAKLRSCEYYVICEVDRT